MRRRGLRVVQHVWLDCVLLWCWDSADLVLLLLVEEVLSGRREPLPSFVQFLALSDGVQDDRILRVLFDVGVVVRLGTSCGETVAAAGFVVGIL